MTFSTLFHAAPQDLEVNSATFYFNKSVVINITIRYVSKLNTKIFHSNKITEWSGQAVMLVKKMLDYTSKLRFF